MYVTFESFKLYSAVMARVVVLVIKAIAMTSLSVVVA